MSAAPRDVKRNPLCSEDSFPSWVSSHSVYGVWEPTAWTDVCWSSHTEHFERRSEYLEFTYSTLNVNMVQAVYFVGRPAYVAISEIDDIAFDAVTGLGGGLGASFARCCTAKVWISRWRYWRTSWNTHSS